MSVTLRESVAGGTHYRLSTQHGPVHVWFPGGGSPPDKTIVYVHGYYDTADTAWEKYALPQQFALSGQNAMFVVPEAPTGSSDAVSWPDLSQLLLAVSMDLKTSAPVPITVIGHSGAYRTILGWLSNSFVKHITLLDALYTGVPNFVAWANLSGHSLDIVTTPAGGTLANAQAALPSLVGLVQAVATPLSAAALAAKTLYLASPMAHMALVTPPTSLIPVFLRRAATGYGGVALALAIAIAALAYFGTR